MNNNLLYIGLNGFAGSGKDTVAKALRLMLSYQWTTFDEFNTAWKREQATYNFATFGKSDEDSQCLCIAFADQLKYICANMFGIPVERFYYNKETAWIRISTDFRYSEQRPISSALITAEEYNNWINSPHDSTEELWMSLREVLVYVGTYVCQELINRNCFVNGVENTITQIAARNKSLKYVICTDVRFYHEFQYVHDHFGININIRRSGVEQLDNVAEHDLDDVDEFDFIIENDGTYDDLMLQLWNLVHDNVIFNNEVIQLPSRDGSKNSLRKIDDRTYMTCFEYGTVRVSRNTGNIVMLDPMGGPMLNVGSFIPGTEKMIQSIRSGSGSYVITID